MESKLPDFNQAKEFADGVHAVWPEQKWVYLSQPKKGSPNNISQY
jgi:isocitrate lyase